MSGKQDTTSSTVPEGRSTLNRLELKSGADWLASEPMQTQSDFLASLEPADLAALPYLFEFWAHDHQVPPSGPWSSWVILGGRGAGKTRAGAEWIRSQVEGAGPYDPGPCSRVALVGNTIDEVREVMVRGDSGILAISPPDRRPEWVSHRDCLVWPNGAEAKAFSASNPEALRGPQFDCAWADELGCAAIDKGTNQPNKFLDPKSSESTLPRHSNGIRDDFLQMQYLRAMHRHFADPVQNPTSAVYGGPMVDMSQAYVWAWDARPYPWFPARSDVWSDGDNYARGHWLNGRSTNRSLASVVRDICARAGVTDIDTTQLYGVVRGYRIDDTDTARQALQPLMLAHGFDAIERDGLLVFRSRDGRPVAQLDPAELVEGTPTLDRIRAPQAEVAGKVQLSYVDSEGDYDLRVAEAIHPGEAQTTVSGTELPMSLLPSEGLRTAERWLTEARLARDTAAFGLPPSRSHLGAGDVVQVEGGLYRIDRAERTEAVEIEATRVDPEAYVPHDAADGPPRYAPYAPPVPVEAVFLDLPLLTGDEVPHAPHGAFTAAPWPGQVALYRSPDGEAYGPAALFPRASVVGTTLTQMSAVGPGLIDRGPALRVQLVSGTLASVTEAQLLSGANLAAIGDGASDVWEVFQFTSATLVAPRTYDLTLRLRGQAGSDGVMPDLWPAGSRFVLLNGTPEQIDLPLNARGTLRHYRYGPAARPFDHPSYRTAARSFAGIGLRPYAPAHLDAAPQGGDIALSWIRRTRLGGDDWGETTPLGEAREAYRVIIRASGTVTRSVETTAPTFLYTAAMQAADGPGAWAEVAQMSDLFGPGPAARIALT